MFGSCPGLGDSLGFGVAAARSFLRFAASILLLLLAARRASATRTAFGDDSNFWTIFGVVALRGARDCDMERAPVDSIRYALFLALVR